MKSGKIAISGADALVLRMAGYKAVRQGRQFKISENKLFRALYGRRAQKCS